MEINERSLIKLIRRDISNYLIHLTKATQENKALDVLRKIINEEKLIGGTGYIKSYEPCICFSESPITEVAKLLKANEITNRNGLRPRYEPYGVVIAKEWAWKQGARPVIYQPDSEYYLLPDELRYRHVRYELESDIDFTWEREWRLMVKEINLNPKYTIFIVQTQEEVRQIKEGHFECMAKYVDAFGENALPAIYDYPWRILSLDIF